MAEKEPKTQSYTAKDIQVLEGLEPVRKRPGMYIGSTGMEGLHHLIWEVFDNSVTFDTPVLLRDKEQIRLIKIGELIDGYFNDKKELVESSKNGECEILRQDIDLESLSFNKKDLGLNFTKVFSLIRHKVNSDIYKITLQNGRQVDITPYHSLFTLKQGQVVAIKGADISEGTPIIVPKNWPDEADIETIDLINESLNLPVEKTSQIKIYGLARFLSGDKDLADKIKTKLPQWHKSMHRSNIWHDFIRNNYLPFNLIRHLSLSDVARIKANSPLLGGKSKNNWRLPYLLPVTKELVELLGIFEAEGSVISDGENSKVIFSFGSHERDLIDYTRKLIRSVFGYESSEKYAHSTASFVGIYSSFVALILKEILKTGERSRKKRIPELILNVNNSLKERFLIGYLAGDGYPNKVWLPHLLKGTSPSKDEIRKFNITSASKELVTGFSYLLAMLGKTYSSNERKAPMIERLISITYKGKKKNVKLNSGISFSLDFYWHSKSSYISYLPVSEIVSKVHWQRPYSFSIGAMGMTSSKALGLFEQQRIELFDGAENFISSDLGILRVKRIEKINYEYPWVYDISVPEGENFVGGLAPICLHNSLDEAMAGHAKNIEVALLPENKVRVTDDGRGIPTDPHPKLKKSALELATTTLHAGGKFGGDSYKVSGGLHGVGLSVVNALSTWMRAEVHRKPDVFVQEYRIGKPLGPVKKIGRTSKTGTIITFQPDKDIFKEGEFDWNTILNHLRQQAYLTKGVKIVVKDERNPLIYESKKQGTVTESSIHTFYFEGGIVSYVSFLNRNLEPKHKNIFYVGKDQQDIFVEVALQYVDDLQSKELSFANNIHTIEGGMHLTGFRSAITRTLNDYARKN